MVEVIAIRNAKGLPETVRGTDEAREYSQRCEVGRAGNFRSRLLSGLSLDSRKRKPCTRASWPPELKLTPAALPDSKSASRSGSLTARSGPAIPVSTYAAAGATPATRADLLRDQAAQCRSLIGPYGLQISG